MKIRTTKHNLIVSIPLKKKRYNPYEAIAGRNPYTGEMDNITGLIIHHDGYDEIGFVYLIDMDYKGKDDQIGDWAVMYDGDAKSFKKLCKELKIPLIEMNSPNEVSNKINNK